MRAAIWIAVAALVATGCSGGRHDTGPGPTVAETSTTAAPDYSAVDVTPVRGTTTSTISKGPGGAHLSGTVNAGPDGPVAGATVHVERLVGDGVVATDVVTANDGSWHLDLIPGGRYRVRAWRAPDLAILEPVIFFLNGTETRAVNLDLSRFSGATAAASIAPNPPIVGADAQVAVQVRATSVDTSGVVRAVPEPTVRAELVPSGNLGVVSPNPQLTDGRGEARWTVHCQAAGDGVSSVLVGGFQNVSLDLAPCTVPPPATAPATTGSAGSTGTSTSSTTSHRGTTTTNRSR
ncbi:MAG: carboxypeptidase-like regulatory domain-containing protein [Acidimicrobiales bacterium]